MNIEIYNANQIGGCITTIQSNKGTKICIDIGENLPSIDGTVKENIKIPGLTEGKAEYDAVFVTHYHGDHIGLYDKILPEIPIYIGDVSKKIYTLLQQRLSKAEIIEEKNLELIEKFKTYKIPNKVKIKDITITPIEVDHSAFDAHMLLIECDGKKVLHTGDFRIHGQRGKSVIKALEQYVGKVDCLICEGTTLSRKQEPALKETQLQNIAEKIFRDNKYVFVLCSSTNIDRIAALHKAALKANRLFVCDEYQKEILMYIDSIARSELYKFKNKVLSYADNILELMENRGFVMLVRNNYISKKVMKKFPENTFIYSMWEGYLNEKFTEYKHLQEFVPKDYIYLHTSGHADYDGIKKVCETVRPQILIPIHGENPEAFEKMGLKNCKIKLASDGEKILI